MAASGALPLEDDGGVPPDLDQQEDAEESAVPEPEPPWAVSTTSVISKFLKGKEREWEAVSQRKGPLTLLELPVDVLRLIVKEVRRAV